MVDNNKNEIIKAILNHPNFDPFKDLNIENVLLNAIYHNFHILLDKLPDVKARAKTVHHFDVGLNTYNGTSDTCYIFVYAESDMEARQLLISQDSSIDDEHHNHYTGNTSTGITEINKAPRPSVGFPSPPESKELGQRVRACLWYLNNHPGTRRFTLIS